MKNSYYDLVNQTFDFPQDGFSLKDNHLLFNEIDIYELIKKYGSPLKLTFLPKIGEKILTARKLFRDAIQRYGYNGKYVYCYCTKSSHFAFVLNEVLENGTQLETSSGFDIDLIWRLYKLGKINKGTIIINNGYKPRSYVQKIAQLIDEGFQNVIPVCDNESELAMYNALIKSEKCNIGLRMATEEEPNFEFYTSRLGIRQSEVLNFYRDKIATNPKFNLKMLHFFVDIGIKDTLYYWTELKKGIKTYCELRKICPTLSCLNIGGGMPIRNSLGFEYDYPYMVNEIVRLIKEYCDDEGVPEPDIYSEFGKYTVGESGATIFSVIGKKQQNDAEQWYMLDNSLINTLPDSWGIKERFILLPINHWDKEYQKVNIGGISCDNADYYNSEAHINQVYLPAYNEEKDEPLFLGFFHTGAYQEALSGYGGLKHCLLPSPKHILIDKNYYGEFTDWEVFQEQDADSMLRILGYDSPYAS
ncbi:MAG: arginine decarboxylase [Saprospiraceae bacterium]|nr:arginine decarboxylase [Saprospiraceae bacterium]